MQTWLIRQKNLPNWWRFNFVEREQEVGSGGASSYTIMMKFAVGPRNVELTIDSFKLSYNYRLLQVELAIDSFKLSEL